SDVCSSDLIGINTAVGIHQYFEVTLALAIERVPLMEHIVICQMIDQADEFARFKIFGVVAFLEIVQLLKYGYRYADVVFIIVEDGIVFINNYRGVEYEDLLFLLGFSHASQRTWFTKGK